eukprot:TRINITY_DN103867_c0_g1_i1.p1 TRINITY_DN103867_c0_g1~~TRINITY_DN103867_c0_g1_i1.p1  ORF type:complete len:281 (-),score=32.74 TRINITY_DN103867_c0_g1_i1:60-902(-)
MHSWFYAVTLLIATTLCEEHFDEFDESNLPLQLSKEEQIQLLEEEMADLRENVLLPAQGDHDLAFQRWNGAYQNSGWFPDQATKDHLHRLKEEEQALLQVVLEAEKQVQLVHKKVKPLYGIGSVQLYSEQKQHVSSSLGFVQDMAWSSAVFDTLFNSRAESFTDLIIGFVVQYVSGFLFWYPFAVIRFAWVNAWTVAEYSDGAFGTRLYALFNYLVSVFVVSLPLVFCCGGCVWVAKNNGAEFVRRHQRQQRMHHHHTHYPQQRLHQPGYYYAPPKRRAD